MKNKFIAFIKIIKTYLRKLFNTSDFNRWKKISSFNEEWDERTIQMSNFIKPNTSVIEFGAGRMVLKKHLPTDCSYTPSDIVDRDGDTIVLDLNRQELPIFKNYDYAIFSGVLEYVNNVDKLISHLSPCIDTFIVSYAIVKENDSILKRGIHGWVNHFTEDEFIKLFTDNGYKLTKDSFWKDQKIYVLKKKD